MKRIALFFCIATALVVSCSTQEKDFQTPLQDNVLFYASFEQPAEEETRVYANEDLLLRWTADDRVSIFNKITYNQQYKFTGETGDNAGGFRRVDSDEFVTGNTISHVVSVYPYQEATKITESEILSVTLPAEQSYAENTFGLGANTMVSVSSDNVLQYKNVGGYLLLKLYGEGVSVSSITLKGNNGEKLAGKASISMPLDGTPTAVMANDATTEITLTCATPVQLGATEEEITQFWFVVPPVTFEKGFTITVNHTGGFAEKSTSKTIVVERNKLYKMTAMEVEKNLPGDNIVFKDPIAKYACVDKFDTNGDGEVSYAEAAAATSLSGLFADWNTVTSFEEIRYFPAVTSTENVFNGLTKLTHITIPDNITALGTFQGCTALETVVLPASLESLPTYCFDGCSSLKSVTLPTGITTIPNYAFRSCAVLETLSVPSTLKSVGAEAFFRCTVFTGIDLPSGFQTIGDYAFYECKAITSVDLPATLTTIGTAAYYGCDALTSVTIGNGVSIGNSAFHGCSSLASVVLPEDMTYIPAYCFQNCTALATITLPSALTTIEDGAFDGCRFADSDYALQLPASVTSIGSIAFGALRHLILPSTTPISITSSSFVVGYTFLYVPSNMVEMYKVRTNWSDYADQIRPISDCPLDHSINVGGTVGEPVDLGLSVKWASWNVGASAPEEYGACFAWGETEVHAWDYDWASYKWCNGDYNKLTKYCHKAEYWDGEGTPKSLTKLYLEDDAARANWGEAWRMPTSLDWQELMENCTWTWTQENGVYGRKVTSNKNGNSIFLPAAGRCNPYLCGVGSFGHYWSSSPNIDYPYQAWAVYFFSGFLKRVSYDRCYGFSIRPVYSE